MENYFDKYSELIFNLKDEVFRLNERISSLEGRFEEGKCGRNDSGDSLLKRYLFASRSFLEERGIARLKFFRISLILAKEMFETLLRLPVLYGKFLKRKIKGSYIVKIIGLGAYRMRIRCEKAIRHLMPRHNTYRIGIFIPTLSALAGAEKYAVNLAKSILGNFKSVSVEIISTNILSERPTLYDIPTIDEIVGRFQVDLSGVKFRYFVLDYNKTENIWDDNFRKVAQLSNEYDLFINCQHNLYHPASKKSLFICHFPHKQLTELAISLPEIQKRHLQKLFVRSYDVFVSNSEFTQEWLLRYWPALKRSGTKVLNPAVSISDTPVKSFSGKENIILTCGRIDPEKKMLELARIFHKNHKKLGSFELHITGSINADNRELLYYYDELKNLSLDNKRIKLHLNASFETLTSLYKRAKIYWHGMGYLEDVETNPIRTEHFGITVIEAMSYGCVPLVHDSGNPPTIIREAGLDTTWKSEQEAVEKLAKMINNPSLDQMACVAAEASIKFSEENFTRSLMKIIKENNLIDKKFAKNN